VKIWIHNSLGVQQENQLLLMARGSTQLRLEAVADGQEVFLYDRSLITNKPTEPRREPHLTPLTLKIPDADAEPDMTKLRQKFSEHAEWGKQCLSVAQDCSKATNAVGHQIDIIKRGIDVAMGHMMRHSRGLQQSFEGTVDFAVTLEQDMSATHQWRAVFDKLDKIEIVAEFSGSGKTLANWIDSEEITQSNVKCEDFQLTAQRNIKDLAEKVKKVVKGSTELDMKARQFTTKKTEVGSSFNELFTDIEALASRLIRDSQHVDTLSDTVANNLQTSIRLQALHRKEFLPQLNSSVRELWTLLNDMERAKFECQNLAVKFLSQLSDIQYQAIVIKPSLNQVAKLLQETEDLRANVARVIDLPFFYGALLLETARRNKWIDGMRKSVSMTAEKMAGERHDELNRRNKWKETYMMLIPKSFDHHEGGISDIEITYRQEESLSKISFNHVEEYLEILEKLQLLGVRDDLKEELTRTSMLGVGEMIQSVASISPFRTTSVAGAANEAGGGGGIASVIKGYQSRIRKLEDLLHRQQYKTSGGPPSPGLGGQVVGSPRLLERVHDLENQKGKDSEVMSKLEREKSLLTEQLQERDKKVAQLTNELRHRDEKIEDAKSLKSDLLANMAAKEAEFANERRGLLEEVNGLKLRVDELEDELDRGDDRFAAEICQKTAEITQQADIINDLKSQVELLTGQTGELTQANSRLDEEIGRLKTENNLLSMRVERFDVRARDLSQRLFTGYKRSCEVLESMGLQASKETDGTLVTFKVNRVKGLRRSSQAKSTEFLDSSLLDKTGEENVDGASSGDPRVLYWMDGSSDGEDERYRTFTNEIYIDYDVFRDSACKRFRDVEHLARKLQRDARFYRERLLQTEEESRSKLSLRWFKVGNLALFLPTRDPTRVPNPWAAFNVGAPHYFLKQKEEHQLANRDYLVARITKVEERVVNRAEGKDEDNPFDLSDGLKWHLLEAVPE
jgi:autophagy-related protein 11